MLNNPDEGEYTDEDMKKYVEIMKQTDLIDNPHTTSARNNYRSTTKYKFLTSVVGEKKEGEGIILPGDINSLKERLQLLCGERAAGNIEATTPEIVSILDECLRRNHISKREYNIVCKKLDI